MIAKTRLELTWVGKENRPRLEPRILVEEPECSHHAAHRLLANDLFSNRLFFGDSELAIKALRRESSRTYPRPARAEREMCDEILQR